MAVNPRFAPWAKFCRSCGASGCCGPRPFWGGCGQKLERGLAQSRSMDSVNSIHTQAAAIRGLRLEKKMKVRGDQNPADQQEARQLAELLQHVDKVAPEVAPLYAARCASVRWPRGKGMLLTCLDVISTQCPRLPVVSPELQSEGLDRHSVRRTGSPSRNFFQNLSFFIVRADLARVFSGASLCDIRC